MSVYIKIKEANLSINAVKPVLQISSSDNILKAEPVSSSNPIVWNTSLISSSKEKKIVFEIRNQSYNLSYGKGQLYFSSLRSHPEKQLSENIVLDNGGELAIDVFYTERQNFIGEIAFYNYDKFSSKSGEQANNANETTKAESKRLFETPQKVNAAPKATGIFFCCGDEGNDKLFQVEQDLSQPIMPIVKPNTPFANELASPVVPAPTEAVEFYKGPCKSTNLFSCCDAGLQEQKFTVVEDYYRDK